MVRLTFNPRFVLTGFRLTRPLCKGDSYRNALAKSGEELPLVFTNLNCKLFQGRMLTLTNYSSRVQFAINFATSCFVYVAAMERKFAVKM